MQRTAPILFLIAVVLCIGIPQFFILFFTGCAVLAGAVYAARTELMILATARGRRLEVLARAEAQHAAALRGEPYGTYGDHMPAKGTE